jgi:ATP-dependent DNA helicase RecG
MPRLFPVLDIKEIDGQSLVVAEVPELLPTQKPCYCRAEGYANGAFVRVAEGEPKLTSYEVQLMLSSRDSHGMTRSLSVKQSCRP